MEGEVVAVRRRRRGRGLEFLRRRGVGSSNVAKLTIAVLMGGPGAEHKVSLASGREVAEALTGQGHRVIEGQAWPDDLTVFDDKQVDVIFPAMHGRFGEGGQLQKMLDKRGIAYVGSDAASSRLAMDKHRAKKAFKAAGLLTPRGTIIKKPLAKTEDQWTTACAAKIARAVKQLGLPCVVKPNLEGSSVGVVIAETAQQVDSAVAKALKHYGDCLIESYIDGRELTVGILGGIALPVIEVRTPRRFYDYQAKYQDEDTEYIFDIDLGLGQLRELQKQASRAFAAIGCRDFGRVDFMMDAQGRAFVLEVNTIPGFTRHSLLPKAAEAIGLSMGQMCEQIAQMAHRRPI